MSTIKQNNPIYKCETCIDTGFYGDNGPRIKYNTEYQESVLIDSIELEK